MSDHQDHYHDRRRDEQRHDHHQNQPRSLSSASGSSSSHRHPYPARHEQADRYAHHGGHHSQHQHQHSVQNFEGHRDRGGYRDGHVSSSSSQPSADSRFSQTQRQVAAHYSQREDRGRHNREKSPIFHLRKYNNWVKAVLIQKYCVRNACVLDLCCGKGGDLVKWIKARAQHVVAVDHAEGSVRDAIARYNNLTRPPFTAEFYLTDCFKTRLRDHLHPDLRVQLVSCQFSLHYSFETRARANRFLDNVSDLLVPGGYFIGTTPDANKLVKLLRAAEGNTFGNDVYRVEFPPECDKHSFADDPFKTHEYLFTLIDAVEACPEYLVPIPVLEEMALEHGLRLVHKWRFHEFYEVHRQEPEFAQLFARMSSSEEIPQAQWEALGIYLALVFQKVGKPAPPPVIPRPRHAPRSPIVLNSDNREDFGLVGVTPSAAAESTTDIHQLSG